VGKLKRKSLTQTEYEKNAITSPSLAGGGKKYPASMPGGSGILDESDKTMPYVILAKEDLIPGMDVGMLGVPELLSAHYALHQMYREIQRGLESGFTVGETVNLHARVVDALYEREKQHPPPPDDGLDDNSSSFEKYEDKQPDWTRPVTKMLLYSGIDEMLSEREKAYYEITSKNWEDDDVSDDQTVDV